VNNSIQIIQPDDWHVHFREGQMLKEITKYSSRVNKRCIAMPNTNIPITKAEQAVIYSKIIKENSFNADFEPLIPCYLTEKLDLIDFEMGLKNNHFIGAKLYPTNATTNSEYGISDLKKIFQTLEIIEKNNKLLLIHGEKIREDIDIFDREKYFIDEDLDLIRNKFPNLKIVLEHVSSSYGVDYINNNNNIRGTITPHHMLLTKKDVFLQDSIDPHHFCMPVVKDEKDLISLRKAACSDNSKFFLGTDSAPHLSNQKFPDISTKPGIFSATSSIELYASIFEEENSLNSLELFTSINGPKFYNLPINENKITLLKEEWIVPNYLDSNGIKIKNFYGGKKLSWKLKN
tara:strand:+ start:194 stop:1231 length:1038 start_codon:yes stop_codon:yes gene_type:complete